MGLPSRLPLESLISMEMDAQPESFRALKS
jgi:hypothetical protein